MNAFAKLSESSLAALISAIESEALVSGNRLMLARHLMPDEIDAVGAEIDRLIGEGLTLSHLSYLLRALLSVQQISADRAPKLELVWTGPEGSGRSSRDTSVVIRELFLSARRSILIAGFAVHQGRKIFADLATRMAKEAQLEVRMFLNIPRALRDTTLSEQLVGRFANEFRREHWPGTTFPAIYYDPRALAIDEKNRTSLHAKCIVVDGETSLVTSANFTEAAQRRNIEAGILVTDRRFSRTLAEQFDALVREGALVRLPLGG